MNMFTKIDDQKNLFNCPLKSGIDVFEEIEEPLFGFITRNQKQLRFEERDTFIRVIEDWNRSGFNTLATFLSYVLNYNYNIAITDIDLDKLSFSVSNGEDKVEVKLKKRIDKDSHPTIIITQGDLIKEYTCDNIEKKGLLIDLNRVTMKKGDRTVTRDYTALRNTFTVDGFGYSTEVSMPKSSHKLLLNEGDLLRDLLKKSGVNNAIEIFKLFYSYSSEEMINGTTNVRVYKVDENNSLGTTKEEIQSLKMFITVLMSYKSAMPFNNYPSFFFTRELTDDYEYLDKPIGDKKDPDAACFFMSEQSKCDEFIAFLNKRTNENPKELKYQNTEE